eukprot:7266781-Pyramimonas_sp.AAC.1
MNAQPMRPSVSQAAPSGPRTAAQAKLVELARAANLDHAWRSELGETRLSQIKQRSRQRSAVVAPIIGTYRTCH